MFFLFFFFFKILAFIITLPYFLLPGSHRSSFHSCLSYCFTKINSSVKHKGQGTQTGAQKDSMTCLKLLIRLKMKEEAELKSPECPTAVALVLRMKSDGSVECSAVAQHHAFGLCLALKSKAKFQ